MAKNKSSEKGKAAAPRRGAPTNQATPQNQQSPPPTDLDFEVTWSNLEKAKAHFQLSDSECHEVLVAHCGPNPSGDEFWKRFKKDSPKQVVPETTPGSVAPAAAPETTPQPAAAAAPATTPRPAPAVAEPPAKRARLRPMPVEDTVPGTKMECESDHDDADDDLDGESVVSTSKTNGDGPGGTPPGGAAVPESPMLVPSAVLPDTEPPRQQIAEDDPIRRDLERELERIEKMESRVPVSPNKPNPAEKAWIASGENIKVMETTLVIQRCKIDSLVRRGGEPDPDCPEDPESMRFWASFGGSYHDTDTTNVTMNSEGGVAAGAATIESMLGGGTEVGAPSASSGPSLQALVGVMGSAAAATPAPAVTPAPKAKAQSKAKAAAKKDPKTPEEWKKAASTYEKSLVNECRIIRAQARAVASEMKKAGTWKHESETRLQDRLDEVSALLSMGFIDALVADFGCDEIDSLNESWMFVLWCSDASPYRTDSASSRFPIAVVPASAYWYDDTGVNMTLQRIASEVTMSFNKLSSEGIKVCWLCEATKGGEGDLAMAFTNTRLDAPWRASYLRSSPWDSPPSFQSLIGFERKLMMGDLLHVFNLGTGRHTAASALKTILQSNLIFDAATIELRMQQATADLRNFAKQNQYQLKMKKLSKSKLKWQSTKYPELGSSGSDCHAVMVWLENLLLRHTLVDCFRDITMLVWSANHCMRTLYAGQWFLTPGEKQTEGFLGTVYINTYLRLSHEAIAKREFMWKTIPKLHVLDHLFHTERDVNPAFYSTWMDEDFLKKISKTIRLTNVKSAQIRVLQRWLLAVPANLSKSKANLR
eukprot:s2022_g16.t1